MERKRYNAKFKAKVALDAFKEDRTLAKLSSAYGVHISMINRRRNELLEKAHAAPKKPIFCLDNGVYLSERNGNQTKEDSAVLLYLLG